MPSSYCAELETAAAALREAAQLCRRVGRAIAPDVLQKRDKSPVTVADFGSQALVCHRLADFFPSDPVVAEEDSAALQTPENAPVLEQVVEHVRRFRPSADPTEVCRWIDRGGAAEGAAGSLPARAIPEVSTGGQAASGTRFWTLDPIDGTKGFLRGEQYAIALALLVDGQVEVAGLACPNLWPVGCHAHVCVGMASSEPTHPPRQGNGGMGRLFLAARSQGCWIELIDAPGEPTPVHVSDCSDPKSARVCESVEAAHSSHDDAARAAEHLGIAADPVRLDSQAKYGIVAAGEAEIYLRLPTRADYREKIWDHAAGALVVTEAGGTVTDVAGKPLEFNQGRELSANRGVIATNGHLHPQVVEALRAIGVAST